MDYRRRLAKIETLLGLGLKPIDEQRYARLLTANLTLGLIRFGLGETDAREYAQGRADSAIDSLRKYGPGWKTRLINGNPQIGQERTGNA